MPKKNLLVKSLEPTKVTPRRHLKVVQNNVVDLELQVVKVCRNFNEFAVHVGKLKLSSNGWVITNSPTEISFKYFERPFIIPQLEAIIDESLGYTCAAYGFVLPDHHTLYKEHKRSVTNITISNFLKAFLSHKLCLGVADVRSDELVTHYVPCQLEFDENDDSSQPAKSFTRAQNCSLLIINEGVCSACGILTEEIKKKQIVKQSKYNIPANANVPLSQTHPNRVKLALQEERMTSSKLKSKIERMEKEIKFAGVEIDDELSSDIMTDTIQNSSPFFGTSKPDFCIMVARNITP